MFRDARGVVHTVSSADPLDDLPVEAARALQDALLVPVEEDLGGALERCDAVRDLVERWQDAFFAALPPEVDLAEEARYAADAGMSFDELGDPDEDDEDPLDLAAPGAEDELSQLLADDEDEDPRAVLPEQLVAVLERELLLLPLRTRLEALVAAGDLVAQWADLLADHEKLLGHMLLRHGGGGMPLDHERLADEHAKRHAMTGPGHDR